MKHLTILSIVALFGLSLVFFGGMMVEPVQAGHMAKSPQLVVESESFDHDLYFKDKDGDEDDEEDDDKEDLTA